jgi:putative FmdB family regulatory protein
MPIYEYVCEKCDHCFEFLVFTAKGSPPNCPQCDHKKVKKLMSAGCVRPKGIPSGSGGFKQPSCTPSGG